MLVYEVLSEEALGAALAELGGWRAEGGKLVKNFQFKDFVSAFGWMASVALVAERKTAGGTSEILGVGRLTKLTGTEDGEFAMLIADPYQRQGLGSHLLERLIQVARDEGLKRLVADILVQNHGMQALCRKFGFDIIRSKDLDDPMVRAVKAL